MKKIIKLSFIVILLVLTSCTNEAPLNINPTTEVNTDVTITTARDYVAETDELSYTVTIGSAFDSDIEIPIQVKFADTRNFVTNARIAAGETTGAGTIIFAADNGVPSSEDVREDFITLEALSILPGTPVEGNSYTVTSNIVLLDLVED